MSATSLYSLPRREGSSAGLACGSSSFGSSVLISFFGGQPVNEKAKTPSALSCKILNFIGNLQRGVFSFSLLNFLSFSAFPGLSAEKKFLEVPSRMRGGGVGNV